MIMKHMAGWLFPWLLCWSSPAVSWDLRDQLADPVWRWSEPQEFDLPGARLRMQRFSASLPPQEAARLLSGLSSPRFSRLQASASGLRLSGLSGAMHWLAQLQPRSMATVGEVSSLESRDPSGVAFDARRFAPTSARLVIQSFSRSPGRSTLARLECEGDLSMVLSQVRDRLRDGHWRPSGEAGGSSSVFPSEWKHGEARLSVLHEFREGRVVLTFWHRASEAP